MVLPLVTHGNPRIAEGNKTPLESIQDVFHVKLNDVLFVLRSYGKSSIELRMNPTWTISSMDVTSKPSQEPQGALILHRS